MLRSDEHYELLEKGEQYDALLDQYKWLHAIISILVEKAGGSVTISTEVLENYDLTGSLTVEKDEGPNVYTVTVVRPEGSEPAPVRRRRPRKKDTSE